MPKKPSKEQFGRWLGSRRDRARYEAREAESERQDEAERELAEATRAAGGGLAALRATMQSREIAEALRKRGIRPIEESPPRGGPPARQIAAEIRTAAKLVAVADIAAAPHKAKAEELNVRKRKARESAANAAKIAAEVKRQDSKDKLARHLDYINRRLDAGHSVNAIATSLIEDGRVEGGKSTIRAHITKIRDSRKK